MFGIGMPEMLLILAVALIVVGPSKLPDLAKSLGKGLSEFRRATDEIKSTISEHETYKDLQGIKNSVQETVDSIKPSGLLDLDVTPSAGPAPELKKFEAPPTTAPSFDEALLEPKEPMENLEGRMKLMDAIVSEHQQLALDEAAQPAPGEAPSAGQASGEQTSTDPAISPEAPKKADA